MKYTWVNYCEEYRKTVEDWMDPEALHGLGMDCSWHEYYDFSLNDELSKPGENFWCKVVLNDGQPVAAIALYLTDEGVLNVSEFVVAKDLRGQGLGSQILSELLSDSKNIIGVLPNKAGALILLENATSKRAFEKAGFVFSHIYPDGDAAIYTYGN